MRGIPECINTKHDVLVLKELALAGKIPRKALKEKFQAMLDAGKVYVFDKVIESPEKADGKEPEYRVLKVEKEDGSVEWHQYKLSEDPGAPYRRLGFTKEEFESIINSL